MVKRTPQIRRTTFSPVRPDNANLIAAIKEIRKLIDNRRDAYICHACMTISATRIDLRPAAEYLKWYVTTMLRRHGVRGHSTMESYLSARFGYGYSVKHGSAREVRMKWLDWMAVSLTQSRQEQPS